MDTQPLSAIKINTKNSRIFPSELGALITDVMLVPGRRPEARPVQKLMETDIPRMNPISGDTVAVMAALGNVERGAEGIRLAVLPNPPEQAFPGR
ncbi:MAG: hypothetical protein E5Y79_25240 [Mesorhizobium sp.]|uniref:hypothetical protein n=1 Tax=Mesorhizobium sp. TaxID=1871066 RepID=UPI0012057F65|nr:hypothetical protein [Mesorhizobium sp.]TIL57384.1 MAG: hypothetical protein E5Y79_25240 [Mesorhizobium sp.]